MRICLPLRCRFANCRGRSAYPTALWLWPSDISPIVLSDTVVDGSVVLPHVGTASWTTAQAFLKPEGVLAGGWPHRWPDISQHTVVVAHGCGRLRNARPVLLYWRRRDRTSHTLLSSATRQLSITLLRVVRLIAVAMVITGLGEGAATRPALCFHPTFGGGTG